MTINILVDVVVDRLRAKLADFRLREKNGNERAPTVFPGYLPMKRSGQVEDFPYLIVRPVDGKDLEFESTAKLRIIVGTYDDSDDGQGWRDVANLIQRAKDALLDVRDWPNGIQFNYPVEWTIFDEQVFPHFIGEMFTLWTIPMMNQDFSDAEREAYGDTI